MWGQKKLELDEDYDETVAQFKANLANATGKTINYDLRRAYIHIQAGMVSS